MIYITIDAGTTNTRAKIWRQDAVVSQAAIEVGVRDTAITGNKRALQQGVRSAIERACQDANICEHDISAIVASGMITSELGLWEIPHLLAPAGIDELATGMTSALIPEVSRLPIWFIPGVKNNVTEITLDNCEQMDMMRGEEVEIIGAIYRLNVGKDAICILPGSHTKFIEIDKDLRIRGCLTTLTGELLGVITHNTILSDALQHSFATTVDKTMLLQGACYSQRVGVGRTCFTLRILDRFTQLSVEKKCSFLLGALLGMDLIALKNSRAITVLSDTPVIILGKDPFKDAFAALIQSDSYFQGALHVVDDAVAADIAGYGAITIAKRRGIIG